MKQEYLLSKANKYDRSEATMKITTEKLKDNQINIDWMKPSKLDNFLEYSVIITLAVAWVGILASILFS
jgi:hypothetical protein